MAQVAALTAMILLVWFVAGCVLAGMWAVFRQQQKIRAGECADFAARADKRMRELNQILQTAEEAERPAVIAEFEQQWKAREFWKARTEAWESGEM